MERLIVFEEINKLNIYLVWLYHLRGYNIYYTRLNKSSENHWLIKLCLDRGYLTKIGINERVGYHEGFFHDMAFDNIDKIYSNTVRSSELTKSMIALYNDDKIELAFKKDINEKLSRFYYVNFILNKFNQLFPDEKILFVPSNGIERLRTEGEEFSYYHNFLDIINKSGGFYYENMRVIFPWWVKIGSRIKRVKYYLMTVAAIFWLVYKYIFSGKNERLKKEYRFCIAIISPKRQFANQIQKIDFLLDSKDITKENSIFVSYSLLSNENKEYMKKNDLTFIDDLLSHPSRKSIKKIMPHIFYLLGHINTLKVIDPKMVLSLLINHVKWDTFEDKFRLRNLITYADFSIPSLARNIILMQSGTKTWYYLDSVNFTGMFLPENSKLVYRNNLFGFLYYDYFISWNTQISDFFKSHNQAIKEYINVGCLWAEHLNDIKEGKINSGYMDRLYSAGYKNSYKVIAVFNSSVSDAALLNYEDSLAFVRDICRLLEDIPNMFIVFKEKEPRDYVKKYSKEIISWLEVLEKNPRCFLTLNKANSSEIIAFSDLIVSFPFTSTTFEALSARRKAVWYDAANKLKNTFYDSTPGLVCHSYEELLSRVNELLFEISDEEYNNYLDKYIKNRVEPYLDGKAISRFRSLLIKNSAEV